jgi:hypothetical protein
VSPRQRPYSLDQIASARRCQLRQDAKRKAARHARGRVPGWNSGHPHTTTLQKHEWIRARDGWQYAFTDLALLHAMATDARNDGIYSFDGGIKMIMRSLQKHVERMLDEDAEAVSNG